jgi:hypothetical protein
MLTIGNAILRQDIHPAIFRFSFDMKKTKSGIDLVYSLEGKS